MVTNLTRPRNLKPKPERKKPSRSKLIKTESIEWLLGAGVEEGMLAKFRHWKHDEDKNAA